MDHADETMDKLQGYTWTYSFYVDHEASPEWMITVYDGIYITRNRLYRLAVPARGGTVALLYHYLTAEPKPEELLEQFAHSLAQDREEWSYLDKAAYGNKITELMALYPTFNKDQTYTVYGLPTEEEVSYEDALAFATETLRNQYGGENGWSESAYPLRYAEFVRTSYRADPMPQPFWSFVFGHDTFYHIFVFAGNGGPTLLVAYTSWDANG